MSTTPRNLAELAHQSCEQFAENPVFGTRIEGLYLEEPTPPPARAGRPEESLNAPV